MKDNTEGWGGVNLLSPETDLDAGTKTSDENSWVNHKSQSEISLEGWRAHKSTHKEMAGQSAVMNTAISLSWKIWAITNGGFCWLLYCFHLHGLMDLGQQRYFPIWKLQPCVPTKSFQTWTLVFPDLAFKEKKMPPPGPVFISCFRE